MHQRFLVRFTRSVVVTVAMLFAGFTAGAALGYERVYVVNTTDANASVIDPATNAQVGVTPSLPPQSNDIALSPDGRRLYVANNSDVMVLNTTFDFVEGTVPIPHGSGAIAVSPNGKHAYVIAPLSSLYLTVLRTGTYPYVSREVLLNGVVADIAISSDSSRLYLTDVFNGTLKVVSTLNYRFGDIPLLPFPGPLVAHPDNLRVYVGHPDLDLVSVVDFGAGTITTIAVPNPTDLAVTPDGSRVYVTNGADDAVTAIDTATLTIVATIAVGDNPAGLAVSADSAFVYVANQGTDDTSVIATATNTVTATIPVGDTPALVAYVVHIGPRTKYECAGYGWQNFTNPSFRNEGECIAFYNSIH